MFVVGRPGYAPVVGHVDGIAAESGLRRGDTVLAVGDRVFPTWDGMQMALLPHALDREDVALRVREAGGQDRVRELELSAPPESSEERSVVNEGASPGRSRWQAYLSKKKK